ITPNRGASSGAASLTTLAGACSLPLTPSFRTGGFTSPATPAGAVSTAVLFSPTSSPSPPPPVEESRDGSPSSLASPSGLTPIFCVSVGVVDASNEADTRLSEVLSSPVSEPVAAVSSGRPACTRFPTLASPAVACGGPAETVVALVLVLLLSLVETAVVGA
ncbi:unnamed protein product, partial [Ectocarpus fasciculatus]